MHELGIIEDLIKSIQEKIENKPQIINRKSHESDFWKCCCIIIIVIMILGFFPWMVYF